MSGNIRDLFDNQAELDDEEDDESFDEDTGETTRRKPREGRIEDSSEEEDDDDDEEEAQRVCRRYIDRLPCQRWAMIGLCIGANRTSRSAKVSSSTKTKRKMKAKTQKAASAERRRSAVGPSATTRSSLTRKISTSSERPSLTGSGTRRLHRYVSSGPPQHAKGITVSVLTPDPDQVQAPEARAPRRGQATAAPRSRRDLLRRG